MLDFENLWLSNGGTTPLPGSHYFVCKFDGTGYGIGMKYVILQSPDPITIGDLGLAGPGVDVVAGTEYESATMMLSEDGSLFNYSEDANTIVLSLIAEFIAGDYETYEYLDGYTGPTFGGSDNGGDDDGDEEVQPVYSHGGVASGGSPASRMSKLKSDISKSRSSVKNLRRR